MRQQRTSRNSSSSEFLASASFRGGTGPQASGLVAHMTLEGGRQRRARLPLGQVGDYHINRPPLPARPAKPIPVWGPSAGRNRDPHKTATRLMALASAGSLRAEQPHLTRPGPGQRIGQQPAPTEQPHSPGKRHHLPAQPHPCCRNGGPGGA